ncbi:MAG: nucleotidyltransferase family protein [Clostridia bacterium]|nr:nucleotidyltransferase family protein [Clostridia bacterium]
MINYELYEKCLIGIIKDAILNKNDTEIPKEIDIDILSDIAEIHKIANILCPVLEKKGIKNDKLSKEFNFWLTVESNQQYYLEKLKKRFEEEKIRFICIKGAYMRTVYPETYMRSSTDLDIYVDDENTERVRDIITEFGGEIGRFSHQMKDDTYNIGKFVHIEIHRNLFNEKCPWSEKCQEIIDRTLPKQEGSYEQVMSSEDFYLHMLAHMAYHLKYIGCGIRMVLDIWVYLNKFSDTMDREILDQRLKDCELDIFEKEILKLVDYWFNGKDADAKTKALAKYIFESGLFGNSKQNMAMEMATNVDKYGSVQISIFKKLKHYTFLPYHQMCIIYPKLQKYPILLPYYWFTKGLKILLFNRKRITEVVKSYDGIDLSDAKKLVEFKKSIGL